MNGYGLGIHAELFGPEAAVAASTSAPRNPPELMIVGGDGSRYRTNEADRRKGESDTNPAAVSDPPSEAESGPGEPGARERDSGWREEKVGVLARAERGFTDDSGEWRPPKEIVKTCVATTEGIEAFGRDMRTEAERRGIERAKEVVFVSDNGHGMPQMMEREFPEAHHVTDYKHASDRLKDSARIVHGEGPGASPAREAMRHELKALLWDGEVGRVIERLAAEAAEFAPRPAEVSDLAEGTPGRALWAHVFYFEKWKGSMDYPGYRRRGWPIASSSIESACGQIGERIKHARMRWTRRRAGAMCQVKAAMMSGDGRWERRRPTPIPALDVPALAYPAQAA